MRSFRTVNLNVAFGRELHANRGVTVTFQLYADTHDAFPVAKQSFGFLANERFERRSQFKVNAGDDEFVGVLAVHISAYGFG